MYGTHLSEDTGTADWGPEQVRGISRGVTLFGQYMEREANAFLHSGLEKQAQMTSNAEWGVSKLGLTFLAGGLFSKGLRALGALGELGEAAGVEGSVNYAAHNAADALRLKTTLALKDAGILDKSGQLTQTALDNAERAIGPGAVLNNESVVRELTKDGSQITDWTKLKTPTIELPSGQRVQVHFYQNQITGEINYTHPDFKVKGVVNEFYTPHPLPNSRYVPLTPQDILAQYKPKF